MELSTNIHAKWLWNPMSHNISKLEIHPNKVNESFHDIYKLEIHTWWVNKTSHNIYNLKYIQN